MASWAFDGSRMAALASTTSTVASDHAAMLNSQLASALSLTGDAQYWEESISPATIRQSLIDAMPSDLAATSTLLRAMKWLLASISKGRNVSDFYPHVVKLVGAASLEVRKMVYMYLVQYADHDATTRELSLLSINSFQRGLADNEPLIRALALRVLTSIRLSDILQIQMLAVQKCVQDRSPYVRKCAANAAAKLYPHAHDDEQRQVLWDILVHLLRSDQATMVLTSALVALQEISPEQPLDYMHTSLRKICHLLTDMDEWGQVVVVNLLARYIRQNFAAPKAWRHGTAERIDGERRVRRTMQGISPQADAAAVSDDPDDLVDVGENSAAAAAASSNDGALPPRGGGGPKTKAPHKVKRRVVRKGFYSDEEDDSSEEEVYAANLTGPTLPVAAAFRQVPATMGGGPLGGAPSMGGNLPAAGGTDVEELGLHQDHLLVLHAAMPLLKSRNAGVVWAVCSLLYYCGVSSVRMRSAMGKALLRIHRDHREIQYVVLSSIRHLVTECPSAFMPFLRDFFVGALDPPFTRHIKLDILTGLALDPPAIQAVMTELRSYIRYATTGPVGDDRAFGTAALRAVGRVVELARIVHDRQGRRSGQAVPERAEANLVALNALHGLLTLTQACSDGQAVGNALIVMVQILQLLLSDAQDHGDIMQVQDPNQVQNRCVRRMLLLLVHTLSSHGSPEVEKQPANDDDDDEDDEVEASPLQTITINLPPQAVAAALWMVGEQITTSSLSGPTLGNLDDASRPKIRLELMRLLVRAFCELDPLEKEQGIHLASKMLISKAAEGSRTVADEEGALCEHLLSMGRIDVHPDVRDRARCESALLRSLDSSVLQADTDNLDPRPVALKGLSLMKAQRILLQNKPAFSCLPVQEHSNSHDSESDGFRFGTLSSLVGHRARSAYVPLPPWRDKDTPSSLRKEAVAPTQNNEPGSAQSGSNDAYDWTATGSDGVKNNPAANQSGFYESSSEDDEDEGSSSSSSSGSSSDDDDDSSGADDEDSDEESSDDDESSEESVSEGNLMPVMQAAPQQQQMLPPMSQTNGGVHKPAPVVKTVNGNESDSDDDSSDEDESDAEESSSDEDSDTPTQQVSSVNNLINAGSGSMFMAATSTSQPATFMTPTNNVDSFAPNNGSNSMMNGSLAEDFKGLVLAPIVADVADTEPKDANLDRDSSAWFRLVRPEHSGGLSVLARYIRGVTKAREAQLMGLTAEKPSLVCVQLRFENQKKDTGSFRRLRILQRSSGSSGSMIGPRKAVVPQEIAELRPGQRADGMVGIDFTTPSDRDDTLQAKFDIKFGSGGIPIELKPSLAEVLLPCKRSAGDFDSQMRRLQGFQRVETTFAVAAAQVDALPSHVIRHAALTPVGGKLSFKDENLRLVGSLPASADPVYVLVQCSPKGSGRMAVCSENTLAANSVLNILKRTIQSL